MTNQRVMIGNCLDVLRTMESESIDVCVTSPPYWALRDYGSDPVIYGGDTDCQHVWQDHTEPARGGTGSSAIGTNKDTQVNNRGHPTITSYCTKCGAWKGQLGLEPSPYEYIEHLITIFDEVKRVLKPTGACWVNIGDTYGVVSGSGFCDCNISGSNAIYEAVQVRKSPSSYGFKSKSLVQIPSRFAIAMTDRGWILRNEIIWHKPSCMPSSVKDRFTVDFEKFYFFVKEPKYYFKQQKEPIKELSLKRAEYGWKSDKFNIGPMGGGGVNVPKMGTRFVNADGRNMRTTWSINTEPSEYSHCAMFPKALIDIPIKSCCPDGGIVLDPFCGSGTTLEYCFENDIEAVGIEINPEYKDIINKRARIGQTRLTG